LAAAEELPFLSILIWKNALKPGLADLYESYNPSIYEGRCVVPNAARFLMPDEEIVRLSDSRLYRSLSRTGLLLIAASLPGLPVLEEFVEKDPFSVGMYCAIEQGPNDFGSAKQMAETTAEDFAVSYKRLRSAKQYLNQLPSVPPSQLGILMGIMGPQCVYQHSRFGCLHALEQAESDLNEGIVQAAVVCSSFTLEDPLINRRVMQSSQGQGRLSEGAATIILRSGGGRRDWAKHIGVEVNANYGMAGILIGVVEND
jgi:hypothetical protein